MIHFILGTEAELIKVFPLMIELRNRRINYNFIATGQHNLIKSEILSLFKLKKPDIILYAGQSFVSIPKIFYWFIRTIFKTMAGSRSIFKNDRNGLVIVHGDTISTLLGVILARISRFKVAHIEAGLRSRNIVNPFPEELIRRCVSMIANINFCPGQWAYDNLAGCRGERVEIEHNTLLDSLKYIRKHFHKIRLPKMPKKYFVFILHRHESLYSISKKKLIINLIEILHEWSFLIPAVFVVHHTTVSRLEKYGLMDRVNKNGRIIVFTRQSYLKFMKILSGAEFIASDGGSNQEESFYMGLPALILRKNTERIEGIEHNVVLSGLDFKLINKFFKEYKNYRQKPFSSKKSPSKIVLNYFLEHREKYAI